ncbi:MAG TPA: hypothetical protein PK185_02235 [Cyclobacteriaceae bacterium]|jgi:uncharacterized membrane protein|nr:hypothetical protein [Cyclobacteriaceae bacterium]
METLLPDWAPNVHPMLVHFPIAIFITAIVTDLSHLLLKKEWLRKTVTALFVFAALVALVTYLSGKQAIDIVSVPMRAELTASNHSDWGLYTMLYFSAFAIVRGFLFWKEWDKKRMVAILLFCGGVAGAALIGKTADLGAKLVYKYGVGIQKLK